MALDFELRVSLQKLLIGLMVFIVPLSILGLYLTTQSDRSLEQTVGTHFKVIAERASTEVSHSISDLVIAVGKMAIEPAVQDAITSANHSYQGLSDAAISAKVEKIKTAWNTAEVNSLVKDMLSSRASRWLSHCREIDPRFLRVTVTDEKGAAVAATHKPADYFQADEKYWQPVRADGRGAINLTDILYDANTRSNYIGISVPVLDEISNRFIGAMNALVDVSSLFLLLNPESIGPTAQTLLVKDDGTVISAANANLSMKLKSEEYAAVHDAQGTLQGSQTGYVVTTMASGVRRLVGFADTGLKQDYGNLGWIVLVSQDEKEATAPIRAVGHFAFLMVLLGLLMVTLLAVFFFLHRRQ
jgi:hypothetical protein